MDFFEYIKKLFKYDNQLFDSSDYKIQKVYLSEFGSNSINGNPPRGKSFCLEINGNWCPNCKRNHENARSKTFFYWPKCDLIELEFRKEYIKNKFNSNKKLMKKKLSTLEINDFGIFFIYCRCNWRYPGQKCKKIRIINSFAMNEFKKINNDILEFIS